MTVIIKIKEVSKLTSLSKATIYREMKKGTFPKSIQLTERNVGWLQSEIEEWIAQKTQSRNGCHFL